MSSPPLATALVAPRRFPLTASERGGAGPGAPPPCWPSGPSPAGAVAVVAARQDGPVGYRTADRGDQDLAQHLTSVGAVEPVDQAAVAFPVAGTVAAVDVKVGDAVTTGQTLATLDPDLARDGGAPAAGRPRPGRARCCSGPSTARASASPSSGGATVTQASATQAGQLQDARPRGTAAVAPVDDATPTPTTTVDADDGSGEPGERADRRRSCGRPSRPCSTPSRTVDAKLGAAQQALDSATQVCAAATSGPARRSTTTTTTTTPSPATHRRPRPRSPDTDPTTTHDAPTTRRRTTTTTHDGADHARRRHRA